VVREDVGTGRDYKQAATDAFKRAAVRFGIAHELYAYGQNWVELDGEARFAKPIEDPAVVYARRNREGNVAPTGESSVARALDEETCPRCGGRMWDNRLTKRNPRAPDFKCRDRSCDGVIWPNRSTDRPGETGNSAESLHDAKSTDKEKEHPAWAPLASAPLIPEDAELPF